MIELLKTGSTWLRIKFENFSFFNFGTHFSSHSQFIFHEFQEKNNTFFKLNFYPSRLYLDCISIQIFFYFFHSRSHIFSHKRFNFHELQEEKNSLFLN